MIVAKNRSKMINTPARPIATTIRPFSFKVYDDSTAREARESRDNR
jgi:hypothetical protein